MVNLSNRNEYTREWRKNNKERVKGYNRKWRKNNPNYDKEHRSNYMKQWRENNPNYHKNHSRQWREENIKHHRQYIKEYQEKYPERIKAINAVNNAIKLGKMIRPDRCSNCKKEYKPDGHHEDYSKF